MSVFSNITNTDIKNNLTYIVKEVINSTFEQIDPSPIHQNEKFHNKEPTATAEHGEHQNFLSAKSLIVIVILVFHTIAAPIFEKLSFHYIHESGISMILGMICGLVALVITPTVIKNFNF